MKGQYVVYERATRVEDRFFLDIAEEVAIEMDEPEGWKKRERNLTTKHAGGRPYEFEFRPMLIVLMLMIYHRKEYREMPAYLRNHPSLLRGLGLTRAPSKSIIPSTRRLTSTTPSWTVSKNLGRPRKRHVAVDSSGLGIRRKSALGTRYALTSLRQRRERLPQAQPGVRMQAEGEADLLPDPHVRNET